ncbi:LINE-1 type transposase domain containing protein 1 [Dissostichus eleginoides]|uniref:LINE-1 type transposase domain containing protein 1 n=1 Tax=Dissostichus eleginoides TaxID=100907 RepID=A0AAD9BEI5_DISEL|nr:LINE-1 type transposase domain containing protein 1 [Dissostichus eleginoides]
MGKPQKNKSAEKQTTTEETSDGASVNTRLDASSDQDEAPTRTDIMAAINQLNQNVDSKFELVNASIADLKQSLGEVEQRVISTEGGLNEHETRIKALEEQCSKWAVEARSLNERVDDLVSRSRRQNIWIIGVKEGMEKGNPTDFVSKFIPALLGEDNFGNKPVRVDRAHRIRVRAAATDGPPRQLIARIHHDSVKELILRLSSQKFPLQHEGARIFIFPDLGPAVMKQRQQFDNIGTRCRSAGVRCGFRHPATFVVSVGEDKRTFNNPKDAEKFLDDKQVSR